MGACLVESLVDQKEVLMAGKMVALSVLQRAVRWVEMWAAEWVAEKEAWTVGWLVGLSAPLLALRIYFRSPPLTLDSEYNFGVLHQTVAKRQFKLSLISQVRKR